MTRKKLIAIMPIYPPRNKATKKRQILDYKIFEFNKYVELEKSKEKITAKAESVKVAMLNLIKARLSLTKSYKIDDENEASTQVIEKLDSEMKKWKLFTFNEIKEFCVKRKNE